MAIHPTAIIDPRAEIHETAEIGPYAVISGPARIGANCRIWNHAHIGGELQMGEANEVHPFAIVGHVPQITNYDGKLRRTLIGNRNVFREGVSVHWASKDEGATVIGDDCLFMANSHIAHDCRIGNRVILVNGALLAGHVEVQDSAFISGNSVVHQFVRIGRFVMFRGLSGVGKDVCPFMMVSGIDRLAWKINRVGLSRSGFTPQARNEIKRAHRVLFRDGNSVPRAVEILKAGDPGPEIQEIITFIEGSQRGILRTLTGADSEED